MATKDLVNSSVWAGSVTNNAVRQVIGALRRCLGDDGKRPTIITRPRGGYCFNVEILEEKARYGSRDTQGIRDE